MAREIFDFVLTFIGYKYILISEVRKTQIKQSEVIIMTKINERNIINFWNRLADADLGEWISPVAREFANFFESLFSNKWDDGAYSTNDFTADSKIAAKIRGFIANNRIYDEDFRFCTTLDLHNCVMSGETVQQFQNWLIGTPAYSGDETNWIYKHTMLVRANA